MLVEMEGSRWSRVVSRMDCTWEDEEEFGVRTTTMCFLLWATR